MRLIFLNQDGDRKYCGNANELRDISENPGKSSLFFLTVDAKGTLYGDLLIVFKPKWNIPGIGLPGDRDKRLGKCLNF